ncbi:MAG: alpha/beta hydrolase [Firmicutes bacterium]|nr:alpha/beta hydrolase [Bacillota bacterium]
MSRLFPGSREMDITTDSGVTIHLETLGSGEPLLLIHGYPQTHVMWHKAAPELSKHFTLVMPDLRGYGDSGCPDGGKDNEAYSKRAMAEDMVCIMKELGFDSFFACGHDRGARVLTQLAMDYPEKVRRAIMLDIVPELDLYRGTNELFARYYYHWFFLIQPEVPEILISAAPLEFLQRFAGFSKRPDVFSPEAVAEYERCFSKPDVIRGTCGDYKAGAGVDLKAQENMLREGRKIKCPLLVLYGKKGLIAFFDPENTWKRWAEDPQVFPVEDCGHFIPEEKPDEFVRQTLDFLQNAGQDR